MGRLRAIACRALSVQLRDSPAVVGAGLVVSDIVAITSVREGNDQRYGEQHDHSDDDKKVRPRNKNETRMKVSRWRIHGHKSPIKWMSGATLNVVLSWRQGRKSP